MNNWLITDYAQSWLDTDLDIYVTTDVPVHLTLCWTTKPMRVRERTKILRGLPVLGVPYYCFTECTPIEQDEPGDTLGHSFVIPGWAEGVCLWWRFTGTIGGVDSPSTSPIFYACYQEQEDAVALKHTALEEKELAGVIDHADQSVTPGKLVDPFTFLTFPLTPAVPPAADYEVANKKYVDDSGGGGEGRIWSPPGSTAGGGVTLHSSISKMPACRFTDGIGGQVVEFSTVIPSGFVALTKAVVVLVSAFGGTGNMHRLVQTNYAKAGEVLTQHTEFEGYLSVPLVSNVMYDDDISGALSNLEPGDRVGVAYIRDGSNPLDTVDRNVFILGLLIEYST